MGFRHNNAWFDQPGQKKSRRVARTKKAASLGARPTELLRPAVRCPTIRYNMRIRAGRGFTFEELKAAGVSKRQALSIGVPVDHRRRNRSEESLERNVDRLKAYKDRLILFPLKSKKPKKGDSSPEALKESNVTRSISKVLPLPPSAVAEEPRAITAEEKETNAYVALRKARSDARLVGVREIRRKKKEEEEEAKKK